MKQVTGSNCCTSTNKVSIQQSLDGHSFSVPTPNLWKCDGEPLMFEIITPLTLLVPEEVFDGSHAQEMMAANGTPLPQHMSVVWSSPQEITVSDTARQRVVALMAIDKEMLRSITKTTAGNFRYTSPLLDDFRSAQPAMSLRHESDTLYIKVYEGHLRLAEAIPVREDVDVLYFIERAAGQWNLKDFELHVKGSEAKSLSKLIGKRFKKTICE